MLAGALVGLGAPAAQAAPKQPAPVPTPNPTEWIADAITDAIGAFFEGIVTAALNPLLDLLSTSLLATPTPEQLPRIGELWSNSWQIMLACYAILIAIGGIVVMAHESLQTRYSIKEIGPRIVLGFLASAFSLPLATRAIEAANALTEAVMAGGVEEDSAGEALRNLVLGTIGHDPFSALVGLALAAMLLVLLVTYVVRVALTVIMVAGAPLALMCHALPQTEGIARWWWKVFGGLLAIQIAQALALITSLRLFLGEDGYGMFGTSSSGLVNLIVGLGLVYILIRIPVWILSAARISHRRSMAGGIARAYLFGHALRALHGGGGGPGGAGGGPGMPAAPAGGVPPAAPAPQGPVPPGPGAGGGPPLASHPPPGAPLFLPPVPRRPPHGPAPGPPGMPVFRAPGNAAPASPASSPRPSAPAAPAVFLPPGGQPPAPAGAQGPGSGPAASPAAPAPGRPLFQPPQLQVPSMPRRQFRAPAPPTFRAPVTEPAPPPRPPRQASVPPPLPQFSSPLPTISPHRPASSPPPGRPREERDDQ